MVRAARQQPGADPGPAVVAEQAGHSVATLAKHYAGYLDELEDEPNTPAAEAINAARKELKCAQSVRNEGLKGDTPPTESPANKKSGRYWARPSDLRLVEAGRP